jgi:hypothetical protein
VSNEIIGRDGGEFVAGVFGGAALGGAIANEENEFLFAREGTPFKISD